MSFHNGKSPASSNLMDQVPAKPTVIGIYGIPGSGKSFTLEYLRKDLGEEEFAFFEGSEVIASLIPGGLAAFQKLTDDEKYEWRVKAINHIKDEAITSSRVAVVTGHFSFWYKENGRSSYVLTDDDWDTFTHIIYLKPDEQTILSNIVSDKKDRPHMSDLTMEHLRRWQRDEIYSLRHYCWANKILFLDMESPMPWNALTYVRNFKKPATAEANMSEVMKRLEEVVALHDSKELQTFLVFDADRTLSAKDGGRLLMSEVEEDEWKLDGSLVSDIFRGPMGYSDDAFRQATLLLEEKCTDEVFERHCNTVSASVSLRPEFLSLLRLAAQKKHIGAVVVTCGVGRLWTKVLEHHGLADSVKVIGGGRFSSGYIVTPGVKAAVVSQLRDVHELYVWAFGDSPLDIPMLWEADQAVVVVGEEGIRSKTMDEELEPVIREHHLRARQLLLPSTASPRLDTSTLPVVSMDENFVNSIVDPRPDRQPLKIFDATHKAAAKLLMSPMRDAAVFGPMLRQAHANVGRYLATEYVSELIGLEDYAIPHVQGHNTTGYYLRNEATTSIVALMRGGEPMAFGVSDVFPQAMFIHASAAEDVKMHHVQGQSNVILVDSVVNSGKSVIEFIKRVVRLEPNVNITVVAGVVQAEAIADGHLFSKVMKRHGAGLVALRVSENKFTGTKTTDTGNRLFNTTHLA
ncbi:PRTase [Fusarium subglutinans]|uniref:PRTase n=1 Tax=Gibberella subglutinans TaxID=42677 RepID=A0A8H5PZH1_GIBSU|nr:PRTase [Fusarium subglutinans]KAF5606000.1 PRTase [Fusarium subglutinans]